MSRSHMATQIVIISHLSAVTYFLWIFWLSTLSKLHLKNEVPGVERLTEAKSILLTGQASTNSLQESPRQTNWAHNLTKFLQTQGTMNECQEKWFMTGLDLEAIQNMESWHKEYKPCEFENVKIVKYGVKSLRRDKTVLRVTAFLSKSLCEELSQGSFNPCLLFY